jgi:hypothetical protein
MLTATNVGPYTGVSEDFVRTFRVSVNGKPSKISFRILLYGAYNAMGLIGSECNGICILCEEPKAVITDEVGRSASGYFGPSQEQLELVEKIKTMTWTQFRTFVNSCGRLRHKICNTGVVD